MGVVRVALGMEGGCRTEWDWAPVSNSGVGREQKCCSWLPEVPPAQLHIVKHHRGAHMPDLCRGRWERVQPVRGQDIPGSLLAFNVKDLGREAMVPVAQLGKTWAVTFRFKPFP